MSSSSLQEQLLLRAAAEGKRDLCQRLLSSQVAYGFIESRDESGATPLMLAARFGHREIVQILLQAGAQPDARTQIGNSCVHWACMGGHVEIIQDLIRDGNTTLLTSRNANGDSPLMFASMSGQEAAVALIDDYSPAEKHHRNRDGVNAVICAARRGYDAVLQRLLSDATGPSVNTQECNGNTALHCALVGRHPACVRVLLQHDPDLHLANRKAASPLDMIQYPDACQECRQLIVSHLQDMEKRAASIQNQLLEDLSPVITTRTVSNSKSAVNIDHTVQSCNRPDTDSDHSSDEDGSRTGPGHDRISDKSPASVSAVEAPSLVEPLPTPDFVTDCIDDVTCRSRDPPISVSSGDGPEGASPPIAASSGSGRINVGRTGPHPSGAVARLGQLQAAIESFVGEAATELGLLPEHCLGLRLSDLSYSQLDTVESVLDQAQGRVRSARRQREQQAVLDLSTQIVELRARLDQMILERRN